MRKDFTDVTEEEFAQRVAAMTQTLYRVTCFQLPQRADREDAVQETIRKAWEKRDALRDDRLLQTWIIRILLNECHDIRARFFGTRRSLSAWVITFTNPSSACPIARRKSSPLFMVTRTPPRPAAPAVASVPAPGGI